MKIYLLEQNSASGYETFFDCVVIAKNAEEASKIHPYNGDIYPNGRWGSDDWAKSPSAVKATYLGEADPNIPYKLNSVITNNFQR